MSDLREIEQLAKRYLEARESLRIRVIERQCQLDDIEAKLGPFVADAANVARSAISALVDAIKSSPELFVKPRTQMLGGVKCGLRSEGGSLKWKSAEKVAKKIEQLLPEQFETLVKVESKPIRKALEQLSAAELKRLGVTVLPKTDRVVCDAKSGAGDAAVDQLIKKG